MFEELGYYYVGPVDGHDLENLVPILENIRDKEDNKPVSTRAPAFGMGTRDWVKRICHGGMYALFACMMDVRTYSDRVV